MEELFQFVFFEFLIEGGSENDYKVLFDEFGKYDLKCRFSDLQSEHSNFNKVGFASGKIKNEGPNYSMSFKLIMDVFNKYNYKGSATVYHDLVNDFKIFRVN